MSAHPELEDLAAYAAEDLDAERAAQVREHVSGCSECLADLAALTDVTAQLAAVPQVPMPAAVAERLDRALAAERSGAAGTADVLPMRPSRRGPSALRGRLAGFAAGSAAAALIGVVAVGALSNRDARDGKGTTAARDEVGAGSALDSAAYTLVRSGREYDFDNVDAKALQLLGSPQAQGNAAPMEAATPPGRAATGSSGAATGSSGGEFDHGAAPAKVAAAVPPAQIDHCIALLVEQAGSPQPTVVELAVYEGSPAIVAFLPVPDKDDKVDVWFLDAQRCGTAEAGEDVGLLYHKQITRPIP